MEQNEKSITREILFRGKRVDTGEWVFGCLADYMRGHGKCIMPDAYFATRDFNEEDEKGNPVIEDCMAIGGFFPVDPSTVGQFTGLHDKDGNKIFEGDVVRCYDHPTDIDSVTGIVEFENGRYWTHDSRLISIDQYGSIWLTLLGNIHDNPELLK